MGRRRIQQPEKLEQSRVAQYLSALGAKVYTIGTRRRGGKKCPGCGTFVTEHQGTCQTPGLPDLLAFVPDRRLPNPIAAVLPVMIPLAIEVKAPGGRMSDEQEQFRAQCERAGFAHVVGGLDDVIAWLLARGIVQPRHVPWYRLPQPDRTEA